MFVGEKPDASGRGWLGAVLMSSLHEEDGAHTHTVFCLLFTGLAAFDIPLVYVKESTLNQPIFGCNNLSGACYLATALLSLPLALWP